MPIVTAAASPSVISESTMRSATGSSASWAASLGAVAAVPVVGVGGLAVGVVLPQPMASSGMTAVRDNIRSGYLRTERGCYNGVVTAASGLQHAFVLDGNGGGRAVDWAGVAAWSPDDGVLWMNLDYSAADVEAWITANLDDITRDALLDVDPRP